MLLLPAGRQGTLSMDTACLLPQWIHSRFPYLN